MTGFRLLAVIMGLDGNLYVSDGDNQLNYVFINNPHQLCLSFFNL